MKSKENLVFLGMMGSGKTSIGSLVAKKLKLNFIDVDNEIEKKFRKEILKNHISFWLNWSNEILLNRIKNSKKRPLAFNSTENELIDLIKKRSNIYSKSLYEIKCDKLSKKEIVMKILKNYETY
jgi:shikimate kinase/shikimate kinase/3-dehydroquinate synthase